MEEKINEFVSSLIALQQDGSGAVSAPTNWSEKPLLYVPTELDQAVENLVADITSPLATGSVGRWHFFVGSPGNGKSAAAGRMSQLLHEGGFLVQDLDDHALTELPANRPPYILKVSETGKKYARAWIAQDASVLPDPYKAKPNPADELIQVMVEAAHRGISLIVCTNRGVLERAYAQSYLNPELTSACWFRALQMALKPDQCGVLNLASEPGGRRVYEKVQVSAMALDRRSLLLRSKTFDGLVQKAIDQKRWKVCDECSSSQVCPFLQNRIWLADEELRTKFIRTVKRAEVLSGHVVVFREAVALISVLLAGCPADIGGASPCEWVHRNRKVGAYFSLLARRIYMTLYSGHAQIGLEKNREVRRLQLDGLRRLLNAARAQSGTSERHRVALERALKDAPRLSTDLGIERLIGGDGVLQELDIFSELVADDFGERWSDASLKFKDVSSLERECWEIWKGLAEAGDNSSITDGATHSWFARWISAITMRCGALHEGATAFSEELDELIGILEGAQVRRGELIATLTAALRLAEQGAEISQFAAIKGSWVNNTLTPTVETGAKGQPQPDAIALAVRIGSFQFLIPGRAFIWLKRRHGWNMTLESFPSSVLQTARDTLAAAATNSNYDIQPHGVEIIVRATNGSVVTVARYDREEVEIDGL